MDNARWTALLQGAVVDDAAMERWHALFEKQAPAIASCVMFAWNVVLYIITV